jgi:hypothetical protein
MVPLKGSGHILQYPDRIFGQSRQILNKTKKVLHPRSSLETGLSEQKFSYPPVPLIHK